VPFDIPCYVAVVVKGRSEGIYQRKHIYMILCVRVLSKLEFDNRNSIGNVAGKQFFSYSSAQRVITRIAELESRVQEELGIGGTISDQKGTYSSQI